MKPIHTALLLSLLCAACGASEEASEPASIDAPPTALATGGEAGADFDLDDLPEDFPRDLVPPEYDRGTVASLAGISTISFEGGVSYDEAISYYTGLRGEPSQVVGEPGSRLASWTRGPDWVISIFEEDGPLITFASMP